VRRVALWLIAAACLALWLGTRIVQENGPSPLVWAFADVLGHAAAALACTIWLWPRYGLVPLLAAVLAGTFIDVDHAVAAHSLDPARMEALLARPPTHSLAFAAAMAGLGWFAFGLPTGYALAAGIVVHLLGDAMEPAGVPLLLPLVSDEHLRLPQVAFGLTVVALAAVSARLPPRLGNGRHKRGIGHQIPDKAR
jgi:membrane-bound metal-dependent hydrolase YbcI (DUF457 family)